MTIGQRIKRMRTEAGLSQAKLSEKVGVDRSLISQLESDKGTGTSHVAALAYALNVNALWLQTGKGRPDVGYTPPIEIAQNYGKEVDAILELLESTDDRGKQKALIAVQDTLDAHKAWKNSLPRAHEVDESTEHGIDVNKIATEEAGRLVQELMPEILERVKIMKSEHKSSTSDVYISEKQEARDRNNKRH